MAERFTGSAFDAADLAALAKDAGAGYLVMTTRHHDGFCLWDSAASDFTGARAAAGRDFIGELAPALRAAGLGIGFDYSPMDWRFPGFSFPRMYRASAEAMRAQCHAQVRELATRYGQVDVLWYDGGDDWWLGHGGIERSADGWRQRCPSRPPGWIERSDSLGPLPDRRSGPSAGRPCPMRRRAATCGDGPASTVPAMHVVVPTPSPTRHDS